MAHWEEIRHEIRVNERVNVAAEWLPSGWNSEEAASVL